MRTVFLMIALAGLLACGSADKPDTTTEPAPASPTTTPTPTDEEPLGGTPAPADRPEISVEECEEQGTVVGDIGDGAVHQPDYRCPNGEPPIGRVSSGIEGAVCCPN